MPFRTVPALALCLAADTARAEPFTFIALGDAPYGEPAEVYPADRVLIDTINARAPQLVIHVGDIKSGSTPCSDQLILEQRDFMNAITAPVLFTPGDNEWTDCHRKNAGEFDPLERLAFLRTSFFGTGKTLGASTLDVTNQAAAGFPENARLEPNGVMFVTAHVVGSNNNFEVRDPKAVEEFFARDAANVAWLKESFAAAGGSAALVLSIQADMFEFDWNEFGGHTWLRHSGFQTFGTALKAEAAAYGKPVLLIFGDSHVYRSLIPFPVEAPNLLAIEVPGDDQMRAVEIVADPAQASFFPRLVLNPALATQ